MNPDKHEIGFSLTGSETGVVAEVGVKANTSELKNGVQEIYKGLTTSQPPDKPVQAPQ